MITLPPHKRGDTFSYVGTVSLPAGNWTAASQLRDRVDKDTEAPVAVLTATLTPPVAPETNFAIALEADGDMTALWPVRTLYCDVEFRDDSVPPVVRSSDTFAIPIIRDITHD